MRTTICTFGIAILLVASLAGAGWAESLPTFQLDVCAWQATEVFLAAQDGRDVTVEESWQGTLPKGAVIRGLDLPTKPVEVGTWEHVIGTDNWRRLSPELRRGLLVGQEQPPPVVHFKQVVLFLKPAVAEPGQPPEGAKWVGAGGYKSIETSAAWVEDSKVYALFQPMNPGPQLMWPAGYGDDDRPNTLANFKRETLAMLAAGRRWPKRLRSRRQPAAELLVPMAHGPYRLEQEDAITALGGCDPAGVAALEKLMREYGPFTWCATLALAQAYGDEGGAEMTALIRDELAWWKRRKAEGSLAEPAERRGGAGGR